MCRSPTSDRSNRQSGHKPNSFRIVSRCTFPQRDTVVHIRVELGSFRASSFSLVQPQQRHNRSAYVNSYGLARAHVRSATRRQRRSAFSRAQHNRSRSRHYTTLQASPSGSVVMAALETPYATQACEATAIHELFPFLCFSLSLIHFFVLSSSPSLSSSSCLYATRFPLSFLRRLQAGRERRTVRRFCSTSGKLVPTYNTDYSPVHPPNSSIFISLSHIVILPTRSRFMPSTIGMRSVALGLVSQHIRRTSRNLGCCRVP